MQKEPIYPAWPTHGAFLPRVHHLWTVVVGALMILGTPGGMAAEIDGDARAHMRLTSLNIRDLSMGEFAALLSHSGTMQVVASEGAAKTRISVYLRDLPVRTALEAVCRSNGLWLKELEGGVVQVLRQEEMTVSQHFYNDDFVELVTILYPPVADIGETVRNLFADRVIWIEPDDEMGDARDNIQRAFERMDQFEERGSGFGIEDRGSGSSSGSRSRYDRDDDDDDDHGDDDSRHGILDTGRMNLVRELVDRESRVNVVPGTDTTAEGSARERGRRHGLVFVAAMPATNTLLLRSTDQKALTQIRDVVRDLDKPTPQVLLEVKVLNLELEDGQERGIDWLFSTGDGENSGGFTSGTIQGTIDPGNPAAPLSLRGTGFDVNSVVFNHITDRVNARIRLLQKEGRLTTLATPMLLVADNEASRVFIGTQRQFVEDVEAGRNIGTPEEPIFSEPTPKLATQSIGNTLVITPKIHADRTVTIRLLQEDSQLGVARPVSYGGLSFDLEDVQQSSIVTTVVARDGNLLAIGGLISEETGETVKGVPVLMHVPLLGNLFKHKTATKTRNELIVLIRPTVLLAPGEEGPASRDLLRRLSRHPASADGDLSELGVGDPPPEGTRKPAPAQPTGRGGPVQ